MTALEDQSKANLVDRQKFFSENFIQSRFSSLTISQTKKIVSEARLDELFGLLRFPRFGLSELWARRLVDLFFLNMDSQIRTAITGFLKRLRNPDRSLKIRYPLEGDINRFLSDLSQEYEVSPNFWSGKAAAVCLTHDIDSLEGYKFSPRMMEMDVRHGIHSVFNILSKADYSIDRDFVSELMASGFEIGSHGVRHEIGLANRSLHDIEIEFAECFDVWRTLGVEIRGFRAPAFSINEGILSILEKLGIIYDSSIQVCNGHYHSCGVSFPYKYPGSQVWEIPLSIQDDLYFRDAKISETEVLESLEMILTQTIGIGGVAVFNFHPCIMNDRVSFYTSFLNMLCQYKDKVWFVPPGELCTWMDNRRKVLGI